jgi:hypothetical protein
VHLHAEVNPANIPAQHRRSRMPPFLASPCLAIILLFPSFCVSAFVSLTSFSARFPALPSSFRVDEEWGTGQG